MKYLLALVVALILAAVVYRGMDVSRTPDAATASVTTAPVTAAPVATPGASPTTVQPPTATTVHDPVAATVAARTPWVTPPTPPPPAAAVRIDGEGLLIPVQGKTARDLMDTFTDARSQGRSHDAIDIMADAGTPVLAVADGHVEKLFDSERGGLTVYQFEPRGQYAYYYAHLQRYAPGLAEKQAIRRGQVIGYVGSTGNASPDAPHLHFAIFQLGPERRWWEGTAINPYPVLTKAPDTP